MSAIADPQLSRQLPGFVYGDASIFVEEMARIFARTWQYVGREETVARPGQYLTTQIGRDPLLVVRGADGALRAFHNVCPHRGARLLEDASGACKAIVCPYHAWSFRTDGCLKAIPKKEQYFPELEDADVALRRASVDVWRGFVFASADPEAEPLLDYLAEFPEFLDGYAERYEDLREIARFTFDEPVNWKILVENYVEDYHFGFVHPGTLKVFDFANVRTLPTGRHSRILMPYRRTKPKGHSKYPWDENGPSYQGFIFPGTTFQTARNHVSLFRIVPLAPARTIIEIPVFQTPAQAEQFPIDLDELARDAANDMEEDFVVCRSLQSNALASAYRINALAIEHELGVAHFQNTWLEYMGHRVASANGAI